MTKMSVDNKNSVELSARLVHLKEPISLKNQNSTEVPINYTFHNRRDDDRYLKNVFPSGFNLLRVRYADDSFFHNDSTFSLNSSQNKSGGAKRNNTVATNTKLSESFTQWTKGITTSEESSEDCQNYGDEYADVSGPYFRYYSSSDSLSNPGTSNLDTPLNIHQCPKDKTKRVSIPSPLKETNKEELPQIDKVKQNIYLPTAVLPVMIPRHPIIRAGFVPPNNGLCLPQTSPSTFNDDFLVPKHLSKSITLELLRFRDVFANSSIIHNAMVGKKIVVPVDCTLVWLRKYIWNNFHDNKTSGMLKISDVELHVYRNDIRVWRALKKSVVWNTAKFAALENSEELKLLYAIGKQDEFLEALSQTRRKTAPASVSANTNPSIASAMQMQGGAVAFDDEASFNSSGGGSGGPLTHTVSVSITRDIPLMPLKTPVTPYLHKNRAASSSSSGGQRVTEPSFDKQQELANILEQRLMLHKR